MSQQAERISYLIFVHLNKTITPAEQQELDLFISSSPANERFFNRLTQEDNIQNLLAEYGEPDKSRIWQRITDKAPEVKPVPIYQRIGWRYAAAAVLIVGIGSWLFLSNQTGKGKQTTPAELAQQHSSYNNDIAAGTDKAILTLADGKRIVLDHQATGQVDLGNQQTTIALLEKNKITYTNSSPGTAPTQLTYNSIATPRGGQYQLVLPDGTKVWINAGSSLRFPTAFAPGERVVELSGEAYFEVASQYQSAAGRTSRKTPFIVKIGDEGRQQGSVHVLGTHFNVNAYTQQNIRTTLTEGKVKVFSASEQTAVLLPGQQAVFSGIAMNNSAVAVNSNVDTEEVLAWKNGLFHFNNASIQSILEQVSRWYDVDVVYETNTNVHFSFLLDRKMPVSRLLQILELTGSIHFKIEGKTIRVMK